MRVTPLPEFQSEALLPGADFAAIDAALRAKADAPGHELHVGHGRSVWCQSPEGEFGAKKRGDGVLLFARAHHAGDLPRMRAAMAQLLPGADLRWSLPEDAGKPPPNFSLARLASVTRLSDRFLRLRIQGEGLDRLAGADSMHFRLVLPAVDATAPEWPRMAANGQTRWPVGPAALHRPVYTLRHADPNGGWLETDVFLHRGGRTAAWAQRATPGTLLGLAGPSGGGIPQQPRLLLAGDQTAWPAMARILESRGGDATGDVFLLGDPDDYPLPRPVGFRFHQLADCAALVARLQKTPPDSRCYLWAAAEKSGIAALRGLLLDQLGHDSSLTHLAAYWSDKTQPNS